MADKGSIEDWKESNAQVFGSSNPTIDPPEVEGNLVDLVDTVVGEIGRQVSSVTTGNQNVYGSVVKVVATSNIPSLSGLQTIGGYTLQADDLVLLTAQTNTAQNKLKIAKAGAWTDAVVSNYQNLEAYVASNNTVYQQVLPGTSGYDWRIKYLVNVGPARPEIAWDSVSIDTNGQSAYQLDPGLDVISAWLNQPDLTKFIPKNAWVYDPDTGMLTLNSDNAARCKTGSEILVQFVTYGTGGVASKVVLFAQDSNLYWRYEDESETVERYAGALSVTNTTGFVSVSTQAQFDAAATGSAIKVIVWGVDVWLYNPNISGSNKTIRGVFWQ